jgi:hypothetical protein
MHASKIYRYTPCLNMTPTWPFTYGAMSPYSRLVWVAILHIPTEAADSGYSRLRP